jgi:hypothetical protein
MRLVPSPAHWSWWRRHDSLLIGVALVVLLAALTGYNVWAAGVAHRNAATATKVERLSAGACANQKLFYSVFNALVEDTSPHFGSPPAGPIIPGAREKLIGRLYDAERAAAPALRRQGCKVATP